MPIPTGGLVTKLDFSDPNCYPGYGNNIFDLVGSNNFIRINAPTFVSDGQKSYFDFLAGVSKLQTVLPVDVTSQTVFSFSVWAMKTGGTSLSVVFGSGQDNPIGGVPNISLNESLNNKVNASFGFGIGYVSGVTINQNQWYLLTYTADGTNVKLYINDALIGTTAQTTGQIYNDPTNFVIGQYSDTINSYPWYGRVGAYFYYNTAITATDVSDLFNSTKVRFNYNLVAEYDFQDPASYPGSGSLVYDLSGTGNTLTITSGGAWVSDLISYFNLNNNTAIYKSPALGGIANTNIYTLNAWYWLPASAGNGVLYQIGKDNANEAAQIATGFGLGTLFASGGFGLGVIEYTGAVSQGWNFLSYVSTGSSTIAYLNGINVGTDSNVPSMTSDAGICIGTALNNSSPPTPRLDVAGKGRIGYYSIYNAPLTQSDIQILYNDSAPHYDNLVFSYDFSDPFCYPGTGTDVYDLSGSGQNLTVNGSPTFAGAGQSKYFEFDGNAAKNLFRSGVTGLGNTFSVNMWMSFDTASGVIDPWSAGINTPSGNAPFFSINYLGPGILNNGFNYGVSYGQSGTLTTNTWYMVTTTYDGTNGKLYIDGVLVDTELQSGGTWASGSFCIGQNINSSGNPGGEAFDGKVAIIDVWNSTLTAGEISTIYSNESTRFNVTPPPTPFVSIYGGRQFAQGFNG